MKKLFSIFTVSLLLSTSAFAVDNTIATDGSPGDTVTIYTSNTDIPDLVPFMRGTSGPVPTFNIFSNVDLDGINLITRFSGKADTVHAHSITDVTGLSSALDGKSGIGHTHAANDITDATTIGKSVLTAANAAAVRSTIGAGTSSFSGAYGDLTGVPSAFTPSAHNHSASDITSGTLADGRVAQSNVTQHQSALSIAASQVTGTKTSSFISDFVEAAQDAVGNSLSTFFVYDDTVNTITLRAVSFGSPSRSLVSATNATGFQVSSSRVADVCYEGTFQTTSTIGGPSAISVFLETADTNSTTPGDWTTVAQQTNSNTITLAVILQQVDIEPWSLCRVIPAGKYVRIRSGSVTGTATATINAQQQEALR